MQSTRRQAGIRIGAEKERGSASANRTANPLVEFVRLTVKRVEQDDAADPGVRATDGERSFLFRLLTGDLGQGALEGIMTEAIARAARQVTDRGLMDFARQFRILIRGFHGQIPLVHRVSPIW